MEGVKSIYKGGFTLLIGFIFMKMGGLLFKVICIWALPVGAYGEVAVFMVLFNWFALLTTFNITIGLAKFVAQDRARKGMYFTVALSSSLILTAFITAALLVLAPSISAALNLSGPVVYWAIVCAPFSVVYNIGIFYLRGLYEMRSSVAADALMTVVRIALLTGLILMGLTYAPYMAFVLSFAATDAYLMYRSRGSLHLRREEFAPAARALLIYSAPVFISEFLQQFAMDVDRLVLAGLYSTVQAGIYDVAVALCLGFVMISNSYSNALLPLASRSQNDRAGRLGHLRKALKASSLLYAAYAAVILVVSRPLIQLLNPAYMGIFQFLPYLAAGYVLIGYLSLLTFYVNSICRQRYAVYAGAVFAFLNMALNLYLTPGMLYWGSVISLVVSCSASLAVIAALIWRSERC